MATRDVDPREDELLTHVAAGTDIWHSRARRTMNGPLKSGCLTVVVLGVGILWAVFGMGSCPVQDASRDTTLSILLAFRPHPPQK